MHHDLKTGARYERNGRSKFLATLLKGRNLSRNGQGRVTSFLRLSRTNSLKRAIFHLFVIQKAILCYHILFPDCIINVKLAWPTNDRKSRARLVMNAASYQPQTWRPRAQKRTAEALPLAAYSFYCYFSVQQTLLKQYTSRDTRKIPGFVHTV